jgi:septal ring factor EnvC (AmiA/AmiB activator)
MTFMDAILSVTGTMALMAIAVISYFLRRTMTQLDSIQRQNDQNKLDIAVLTRDHYNKHEALDKRIGELVEAIRENTNELKQFQAAVYDKLLRP